MNKKACQRECLSKFQQNFVKNSILTKKLEKTEQSKQKKNLIARVKR